MVQKVRSSKLESRTARLRLPVRKKPYYVRLVRGIWLGYRRTKTAGTWVVRVIAEGNDWTKRLAGADDHDEADAKDVLTFSQAQDEAKKLARGGRPGGGNTVSAALDRYETQLEANGRDWHNVRRIRIHLPDKLGRIAVGALTTDDLLGFRSSLVDKGLAAGTVNRTCIALRAALNLAAKADSRITNRNAWKDGLEAVAGDEDGARNVILEESQVRAIIAAAYRQSDELGLYVELMAVTGARPSQLERLRGEDVQLGDKPRVMMPASRKGRGGKAIMARPAIRVAISESLARKLKGCTGPLLLQPDGSPWTVRVRGTRFADAVEDAGFDPSEITLYALRHTSIVRQLKANVPIRVVAALHDTSVAMIEKNYSKYITDYVDDLARPTLLETAEIIPFRKGVPEVPG